MKVKEIIRKIVTIYKNKRKRMKKIYKSTLTVLLAIVMLLSSLPINSYATAEKTSQAATAITSITVSTQSQLVKALADKDSKTITIKTSSVLTFSIPHKNYKAKTLVINSPKVTVSNSGTFNKLTITDARAIHENAKDNRITVNDKKVTIKVAKIAEVKAIMISRAKAKCNIVTYGAIKQIILVKKSDVVIKGKISNNTKVQIMEEAKASNLTSSIPVDVITTADASITLKKGAEKSTITSTEEALNLTIENKTAKGVKIITPDGKEILASGKTRTLRKGSTNESGNTKDSQKEPTKAPDNDEPTKTPVDTGDSATHTPGDSENITYDTVTFDSEGGTSIESIQVADGYTITNLPVPQKSNNIFLGWYTDQGLLNKFNDSMPILSNITLYAKYTEIGVEQGNQNDTFTLAEQVPGLTFNLISSDASMTANSVKSALILDIEDGSKAVALSVTGANGHYVVTASNGFTEGASYTLTLNDSRLGFKDEESTIRKCSFTIAKEEAYNLKLNDSIIYIHSSEITDITKNGTKVDSLSVPVVNMTESGDSNEAINGTFTYQGSAGMKTGDVLCIYSGNKPEAPKANGDAAKFADDDIAYIKVTSLTGSIGSQTVSYSNAEMKEVIFIPDVLPIAVGDGSKLVGYKAATSDTPGSFTTGVEDLDFSAYSSAGLSKETTIDEGDFLALYTGKKKEADSAVSVSYAEVTGVTMDKDKETVTFIATTPQKMQEASEYYSKNNISGDTLLKDTDVASFEKEVNNQIKNSGFDKKAATYLASLALKTDGFKKAAKDELKLESFSVDMADSADKDLNKISLMSITPNATVEIFNLKTKASINNNIQKIPGEGVRCEVAISFDVNIKNKDGKAIVISVSTTFVEEFKLSYATSGGIIWGSVDLWLFTLYYPSDYQMSVSVDTYNYTGMNISAVITSQNIDITKQIKKIMTSMNSNEITSGVQDLYSSYSDLMDNKIDNWVDLFKQNIFKTEINIIDIFNVSISADFVISADVKVAIGCNFEYQSGTRYCFWANASGSCGKNSTKLIDEKYDFQFYVMGTLGIRAGIRLELAVNIIHKFTIRIYAETGVYFKLYGFFFYQLQSVNNKQTSSSSGALYIDIGIYQTAYLNSTCLYYNEWPLWSAGDKNYVYDFSYNEPSDPIRLKASEAKSIVGLTRKYDVPSDIFNMTCLDLQTGDVSTKSYYNYNFDYIFLKNYNITFSNSNFSLSWRTYKQGWFIWICPCLAVDVPEGKRKLECDMTVTWKNSSMAFFSTPMKRTYHIIWDNLNNDGYTISFDSKGGSTVNSITKQYDTAISAPTAPTRTGYTFDGWYIDVDYKTPYKFSTMPAENIMLYAKWTPRKDTKYKVEHYIQKLGSNLLTPNSFTLYETETLYGTTDTKITAAPKTYEGFSKYIIPISTVNSNPLPQIESGTIDEGGSLVLRLYYTRNNYTLTYKPENGSEDKISTLPYGSIITAPQFNKAGYSFMGWDKSVAATMPADNITYSAQWKANNYTIVFDSKGGTAVNKITQGYGTKVTEPAKPTKQGYIFGGWYRDQAYTMIYTFSTMPADSITLYAKWNSSPDIPYKVQYYQQNTSGTEYILYETQDFIGTCDTTVTAKVKSYEGFTYNNNADNTIESGKVRADGSLTLKLYYERNNYSISFTSNGGSSVAPITAKYGSTVSTPQNITKPGYIFSGWYLDSSFTKPFSIMPAQNIVLYAKWKLDNNIPYKVEYYQQNLTEDGYTLKDTEIFTGTAFSTVEAVAKAMEGCSFNKDVNGTVSSGIVAADGSLILKLFYDRNTYSIRFYYADTIPDKIVQLKYGAAITKPEDLAIPTNNCNVLTGEWLKIVGELRTLYTFTTMPAENLTLYAEWIPNPHMPYQVEHYKMRISDGSYELAETEYLTGTYATFVTAVPKTYEGYSVRGEEDGTISIGYISDNPICTLKLYYGINTYSITFDSNGGSEVDTIYQRYGLVVNKPVDPTKDNCSFKGWYIDSSLTTPYIFNTMPGQNIILYAKWE